MRGLNEFIQNLREVYQTVPEGVIITDLSGKIVFLNKSILEFTGSDEKKWLEKPIEGLFEGKALISPNKILAKKKSVFCNAKLKDSVGDLQEVKCLLIQLESDNKTLGYVFISRQGKEYTKSNPYSNESNSIVRVLNAKKNEVWFITDFQKYLTLFCSDSIEDLSGWTSEEFTHGGFAMSFIMIHPLDRTRILTSLSQEVELRNTQKFIHDNIPVHAQFRFRSKEGSWLWFDDKLTVLERDKNENVKYMIGSIRKFDPVKESSDDSALKLLDSDVLLKDGKTYINLETLLKIQNTKRDYHLLNQQDQLDSFKLTNRELEILSLIIEGLSTDEISAQIFVTKNTVNMHRKQIMKKLQAKNLADLVRKSIELGLFVKKS